MPDIYDIDLENAGINLTPVKKRKPIRLGYLNVLLSPFVYIKRIFFDEYIKGGAGRLEHQAGTEYLVGSIVHYRNEGVFECTVEHIATSTLNRLYFTKILDYKQGALERLKYCDKKIVLEAILNKWFDWCAVVGTPIVIIRENSKYNGFWIGENGNSSYVSIQNESKQFIGENYTSDSLVNFTVQIPNAQFNALSTIPAQREKILRQVVDKYLSAGFIYVIDVI